ncbi:eukaryotic translation initiation factor 5B-like [Notothenia coriiceps]|uniref:Eukaryotic translation initiation factor 5B-like n=1 Tax=Notothenia coriiceps TaxID=8208 RepID=A0A6I9Q3T7_9TELE|nr:PREDICTED: eukaryotic translation initiation factor 5B-like [Notothenia coriiceps]
MERETSNDVMETEEVEKQIQEVNDSMEKGEVDVENGEMSTEKKTQEGEGEVQTDGENDVKRDENAETKAEEPTEGESTEGKEVTVKSEGDAEKAPDVAQTEAEAKQEESTQNDDPDTSGMETKDESKSDERNNDEEEGSKQDENGNVSEPDSENRDSELVKKSDNVSSHVSEVMVASSGDQAQSPTHTAVEVSTAQPDSNTEKHTGENPADHSATDGENGADTEEEASKASEEGASVLLQPQTQSPTQNNTEESVAEVKETPEVLTRENNAEMVTNWVTKHQTSKFFETFVEPLEDLKESPDAQLNANEEETQSTEQARAESPLMMAEISQSVNEERVTSKEEPQSSAHYEAGEQSEKDSQQMEETEVKDFKVQPESDKESVSGQGMRSEDQTGSRRSLDKVQEGLMQDDTEQTDVSKTEVESLSGTQHSVTSGRGEGEEKTSPELNEKQAKEEEKDLLSLSKTEEQGECSTIPEGLSKLKANETKDTEETSEQSREVKEITDFTTSDDGSQEETQRKDIDPQPSDTSINGDRREVQMIEDIKHTLTKDRLSTFSVGEAMFSRSPYPLLTAARTESGH